MANVLKNLLLAAAAATLVVAVSPAFANIGTEAEEGYAVYPSVGQCHFVTQRTVTQNGRVIYERHQVCN
jgi:hypothetical protein